LSLIKQEPFSESVDFGVLVQLAVRRDCIIQGLWDVCPIDLAPRNRQPPVCTRDPINVAFRVVHSAGLRQFGPVFADRYIAYE
jgi:hypothetical protein